MLLLVGSVLALVVSLLLVCVFGFLAYITGVTAVETTDSLMQVVCYVSAFMSSVCVWEILKEVWLHLRNIRHSLK